MPPIKIKVYGVLVIVEMTDSGWAVFYPGADGKRRLAENIVIPDFVEESKLENYLSDLCHEWATDRHPSVHRLE